MSTKRPKNTELSLSKPEARHYAERIYILLLNGRFPSCHKAINEAELTVQGSEKSSLNSIALAQLDLSDRVINLLDKAGYSFIGDLIGVGEEHLLASIPMCGDKTIDLIKGALMKEMIKHQQQ